MVAGAESDPEIRAVVVTGTGDRAFCAGMDLRAYAGDDVPSAEDDAVIAADYMRLLDGDVRVPVVGAVNGSTLAGGFELMLGCDVVVASRRREVRVAGGETRAHRRRRGRPDREPHAARRRARARRSPATASTPTRAYDLGLVNRVVPPDDVLGAAVAIAERIAANGPLAIAATKELVRLSASVEPRAAERLDEWRAIVFNSEDAKEGATAFVEKREPRWQGR